MYTMQQILNYILNEKVGKELKMIAEREKHLSQSIKIHSAIASTNNEQSSLLSKIGWKIGSGVGLIVGALFLAFIPGVGAIVILASGAFLVTSYTSGPKHAEEASAHYSNVSGSLEEQELMDKRKQKCQIKKKEIQAFNETQHPNFIKQLLMRRVNANILEKYSEEIEYLIENKDLSIDKIVVANYLGQVSLLVDNLKIYEKIKRTNKFEEQIQLKQRIKEIYDMIDDSYQGGTQPPAQPVSSRTDEESFYYQGTPKPGYHPTPTELGIPSYLQNDRKKGQR